MLKVCLTFKDLLSLFLSRHFVQFYSSCGPFDGSSKNDHLVVSFAK